MREERRERSRRYMATRLLKDAWPHDKRLAHLAGRDRSTVNRWKRDELLSPVAKAALDPFYGAGFIEAMGLQDRISDMTTVDLVSRFFELERSGAEAEGLDNALTKSRFPDLLEVALVASRDGGIDLERSAVLHELHVRNVNPWHWRH